MEIGGEIEALKSELEVACDALMSAAQTGLELATDTPMDGEIITGLFAEILSLCAFQDLAGQGKLRAHESSFDLCASWQILVLVVALLAAEWLLRKRVGLA